MKMIPEKNYQKMKLEFSKYGQVFENNTDKFSSTVEVIVREHVHVVSKHWHSMNGRKKSRTLEFHKSTFLSYLLRLFHHIYFFLNDIILLIP